MERRKRKRVELQQSHAKSNSICIYPPTPKSRSWLRQLLSYSDGVCMLSHQQPISIQSNVYTFTCVRKQTLHKDSYSGLCTKLSMWPHSERSSWSKQWVELVLDAIPVPWSCGVWRSSPAEIDLIRVEILLVMAEGKGQYSRVALIVNCSSVRWLAQQTTRD